MNTTTYNSSWSIIVFLFLFLSCDSRLDIEPADNLSLEQVFSTDKGVKNALNGAYSLLSHNKLWGGGIVFRMVLFGDTGDVAWNGIARQGDIHDKNILINNEPVTELWQYGYEAINLCNAIITAAEVVKDEDRDWVVGEAKFIRGALYFDLVTYYGKTWVDGDPGSNPGVPLVTTPTRSTEDLLVPRASVADIYEQIIKDLTAARAGMKEERHPGANTYAASALLSRVYLMQERYAEAEAEADRVIESGAFSLLPELIEVFSSYDVTSEDIFTMDFSAQTKENLLSYVSENVEIQPAHFQIYEPADKRSSYFSFTGKETLKFSHYSNADNMSIIRLSEMYLTRGECRFRNGDLPGAIADMNTVRARSNASLYDSTNITLTEILAERYRELCFEGHNFRDRKRTRRDFGDIPFDDDRMVYPVPEREMEVNPMLVQNPGY